MVTHEAAQSRAVPVLIVLSQSIDLIDLTFGELPYEFVDALVDELEYPLLPGVEGVVEIEENTPSIF
jgi:hypothetical protein